MNGTTLFHHDSTVIVSVCGVDAPTVVTSAEIDDRLGATYRRLRLRPGLLAGLAGITERRWWEPDVGFTDAAALAGAKALAESGVDPAGIGLLIDTSVARSHLEPSSAVSVHSALGLPTTCVNFDLGNACLGFLNGMQLAASLIDAGRIDHALIVDGEGSRHTQEITLDRLARPDSTREDVLSQFATLTLGSGAAAMVLGRADDHPAGHRFRGGAIRAATEHHRLCIGDLDRMSTDAGGLLDAGVALGRALWADARDPFGWGDVDRYCAHQVSQVHTRAMCRALDIDSARVPLTFPTRGNMGPAAVPYTLAGQADTLDAGDRVLLVGVGSGLNACFAEVVW